MTSTQTALLAEARAARARVAALEEDICRAEEAVQTARGEKASARSRCLEFESWHPMSRDRSGTDEAGRADAQRALRAAEQAFVETSKRAIELEGALWTAMSVLDEPRFVRAEAEEGLRLARLNGADVQPVLSVSLIVGVGPTRIQEWAVDGTLQGWRGLDPSRCYHAQELEEGWRFPCTASPGSLTHVSRTQVEQAVERHGVRPAVGGWAPGWFWEGREEERLQNQSLLQRVRGQQGDSGWSG